MNLLLHVGAFFIFGVFIYYLDSKFGLQLNRWWYDLTHKHPMKGNPTKGLIINQSIFRKIVVAVPFVLLEIYLSSFMGAASLFVDLMLGASGVIGMVLGFYFSGNILKIVPPSVGRAVDYLEKVERGETDIKEDLMNEVSAAGSKVTDAIVDGGVKDVIDKFKPEKKEEKEEAQEQPSEEEETKENPENENKEWRKGIDKFLKK